MLIGKIFSSIPKSFVMLNKIGVYQYCLPYKPGTSALVAFNFFYCFLNFGKGTACTFS